MPTPPPLPGSAKVSPLPYAKAAPPLDSTSETESAQKVFDTVVGPNFRLRDNLIQLVCVILGAGIGGGLGFVLGKMPGLAIGILGGLIISLVVSGAVIGIVRLITSSKKR